MNNLEEIQQLCQTSSKEMPATLGRVALWIAENLPAVGWQGVDDIARTVGVSSASVIRCVQRLGYSGYVEFQQTVRQMLPPSGLVWRVARSVHPADGVSSTGEKLIAHEIRHLEAMRRMPRSTLNDLVGRVVTARRVLVTANLMSAPMGEYLASHWNLVRGNIAFHDSASTQCTTDLCDMGPDDLVIAIAFPRYSRSTLNVLELASIRSIESILITDEIGPAVMNPSQIIHLPVLSPLYFPSGIALVVLVQLVAQELVDFDSEQALVHLGQMDALWEGLRVFADA